MGNTKQKTMIDAGPHLLWKGKIFHNELVDGNDNGQQRNFGIKIYEIGGAHIYKLPGFDSPAKQSKKKKSKSKHSMLMTGRIAHDELQKYLIKYLGNESKRVVCCKITISKDVSDAQKLIKHLKLKE